MIWGSFWDHFGIILESFWDHFGIILGSNWDHFGDMLVSFRMDVGFAVGAVHCHAGVVQHRFVDLT